MYKVESLKEIIKKTSNGKHLFEVVSLFAGGGGSSTGYRMAGGKVLAVNEFVEEAQNTYKANYPNTYIFKEDIRELNPDDILIKINKKIGELDILDGSPPCSAFSTAGKGSKGWGEVKKYSDKSQANVEDLFFEYIRILRGVKPRIFIAENVAGITKGHAKGYLNEILKELRDSGYNVSLRILNAKYMGVPQVRNRAIFIGVRNDLWSDDYKNKTHPKPDNTITLKEAFKGLQITNQEIIETDIKKYAIYKLLIRLHPGNNHKIRFNLSKESTLGQSCTITAKTGCLSAAKPSHWNNRAFTIREIKRIMSIPDDYILTGNYQKQVERMGRMVAPFMMKAVAENIYNLVLKNDNTR